MKESFASLWFETVKFRTYKHTDLTVSEVGFGMLTISTGWWGNYTEGEALALMRKSNGLIAYLQHPTKELG